MQEYFEPLHLLWDFSFLPAVPGQLAKLDQEGSEDKGEGQCSPFEVAKDEEVDCELYVCEDVIPGEADVEQGVRGYCFDFLETHAVAYFLSDALDTFLKIENISNNQKGDLFNLQFQCILVTTKVTFSVSCALSRTQPMLGARPLLTNYLPHWAPPPHSPRTTKPVSDFRNSGF